MIRFAAVMPAIVLISVSCNRVNTNGNLKVVGGEGTDENSAVVQLDVDGLCTGTFIAQDTILTAAHCYSPNASYAGVRAAKIIRHPGYKDAADGTLTQMGSAVDLMILKFDRALAPATVRIATRSPAEGDKGRMIGFGCAAWNDSGTSGQKRAGNVTISGVDSGTINASENAVYGCPGDSGGPLFNQEGEQIGVASTAGEGATSGYGQTNWVDLTSKSTSGFLAYAASGAGDSLAQNNPPRQENNQPQQGNHQPQQQNNQGYANNFTLNGITYSCPAGYYLATDGYCYRA